MNVIFFNNPLKGNASISPKHICSHCRPLLMHDEFMTTYLERQRFCKIHIQKLAQWRGKNYLTRYVLLIDDSGYTHIASKISIYLSSFDPSTRQQLIESNQTFGNILANLEINPIFSSRHFFKRTTPPFSQAYKPYRRCPCRNYFGRFHTMQDAHQRTLANIYEWIA